MKLIFAQGNPGNEYASSRHNMGFAALDGFSKEKGTSFISKPKFFADIAELGVNGEKVLLVKPTTFYNETGKSARALIDFYKLTPETDMLVVHDDLALPFGTLRTREKGSDAGNNGVKSLNAHLGPDYARLRIGVSTELRGRMDDAAFVLSRFSKEESEQLKDIYKKTTLIIDAFIAEDFEITSHT